MKMLAKGFYNVHINKFGTSVNMLRSKLFQLAQKQNKSHIKLCSNVNPPLTDDEKERELERIAREASIEEPPTGCCQSGCANCVFIAWAEALTKKMENAGPEIAEKVLKSVEDPSMKAYLEMELRLKGLHK